MVLHNTEGGVQDEIIYELQAGRKTSESIMESYLVNYF